jgi:hypothetical protein
MNTKIAEPSELYAVSLVWLDSKQERTRLAIKEATKGLLPLVEAAHNKLQRAVQTQAASSKELELAREEAEDLDEQYDDLYRGIFYFLTALAAFNIKQREEYLGLRNYLLPDELSGVNKSYSSEAGEAGLLQQRLSNEKRAQLSIIQVEPSLSLLTKVELFIQVGVALGLAEKRKQDLLRAHGESQPMSRSELNQIKAEWLVTARTLLSAIELTDFSEQEKQALKAPFTQLEQRLVARAKTRAESKKKTNEEPKKP